METILGIDLGTTNSVVSIIEQSKPRVFPDPRGVAILPSVVGFDHEGKLLVGQEARNQALLAPERTVKSIKRRMGEEVRVPLGDKSFSPQEISAMILRVLKDRASQSLGRAVTKAVITVPAFFKDAQRQATREAGELAGLEVVRIINEPTAASLTYQPRSDKNERLLVYDLGGGTFDVSIVQIEQGVVEVLASHGDTHLGGDDFDELLLNFVCDRFREEHGVDLREFPVSKSRLLQAVEEAKKRLSLEAFTSVAEEFIATKDGGPLHLNMEIDRREYEAMIEPLLRKTITSVDAALVDAKLAPGQIDRVVLVGGSTRTPLVQRMLSEQLGHEPHWEVDPDLCVAMGAAVQGGLIAGIDVGPVLVDITPHTLGIRCNGELHGRYSDRVFSPIISRNTPLPATRSEIYYTAVKGQQQALIDVCQGENPDATFNHSVGKFTLDGLDRAAGEGNEILVRFDLNLDGILHVAAVERDTGREKRLTIDNAISRFRAKNRDEARAQLAGVFGDGASEAPVESSDDTASGPSLFPEAEQLAAQAEQLAPTAAESDAAELRQLTQHLRQAMAVGDADRVQQLQQQLEDIVFYVQDA